MLTGAAGRRGELSKVGVAECLLDRADLLQSVVEFVIAELLVFNFLEVFAHFFHQ